MKLKPPNPIKITKFVAYSILAGEYLLMGIERFPDNEKMFQAYEARAMEYAKEAVENRNEGIIQKVLDKIFI